MRVLRNLTGETRLADARFAADERGARFAGGACVPQPDEFTQLVRAADERPRAREHSRYRWLRDRRRVEIRRG